jgi:outer membrane protein assembly factor BamB
VFDVHFNAGTGTASFTDLSYNLGDQPITAIARDNRTGNLYAATDFGVLELRSGKTVWRQAASGLPPVAVYSLALSTQGGVLYAGTHGRSIYQLDLSGDVESGGGDGGGNNG